MINENPSLFLSYIRIRFLLIWIALTLITPKHPKIT